MARPMPLRQVSPLNRSRSRMEFLYRILRSRDPFPSIPRKRDPLLGLSTPCVQGNTATNVWGQT